jgi:RNA polymerase sigma-70 factor (ECF subfamily)
MRYRNKDLIRTRTTLIKRLKDWQDQASWQAFFDTYWKLIYGVAVKSGLSQTEAEDVVQETMISVAKHMPNFNYDRKIGTFKSWLLNMTRWRITDQFRKRNPVSNTPLNSDNNSDTGTAGAVINIRDKRYPNLESLWDVEWEKTLFEAATAKVKRTLDPKHYQIFDLSVNKEWAPAKIAKTFAITVGQVYLTKHRVREAIKDEVGRLKEAMT